MAQMSEMAIQLFGSLPSCCFRLCCDLVGAYCISWYFGMILSLEFIAQKIIAGESFKSSVLERQASIIASIETSQYCRPSAMRSAAIVQLSIVAAASSARDGNRTDENLDH